MTLVGWHCSSSHPEVEPVFLLLEFELANGMWQKWQVLVPNSASGGLACFWTLSSLPPPWRQVQGLILKDARRHGRELSCPCCSLWDPPTAHQPQPQPRWQGCHWTRVDHGMSKPSRDQKDRPDNPSLHAQREMLAFVCHWGCVAVCYVALLCQYIMGTRMESRSGILCITFIITVGTAFFLKGLIILSFLQRSCI